MIEPVETGNRLETHVVLEVKKQRGVPMDIQPVYMASGFIGWGCAQEICKNSRISASTD